MYSPLYESDVHASIQFPLQKTLIPHCDIHSTRSWFKLEKSHEDTPISFADNKTWPIFSTAL